MQTLRRGYSTDTAWRSDAVCAGKYLAGRKSGISVEARWVALDQLRWRESCMSN